MCHQGITSDLFPGIRLPETDYSTFNAAVRESCQEANLQCTDYFLEKIQQVGGVVRRTGTKLQRAGHAKLQYGMTA